MKCITGEKQLKYKSTIINWGNSRPASHTTQVHDIINDYNKVAFAANKYLTLKILTEANVSCVEYALHPIEARGWLNDDTLVYGREKLTAHSGEGIRVFTMDSEWDNTLPLYTKGILKAHEYRVHVIFGKVVDVSKKKRAHDEINHPLIRNHSNGWVYCREDVAIPFPIILESVKAIAALGLDFGAVDVLYKRIENKAYVLEVNTAPGLTGTTLDKYVEAFNDTNYQR